MFYEEKKRAMHLVAIEEKVAFYLLTYGFNMKGKNMKEKSVGSITPLIKRVYSAGQSEVWKQVSSSSIPLKYFCVFLTPIHEAKQ